MLFTTTTSLLLLLPLALSTPLTLSGLTIRQTPSSSGYYIHPSSDSSLCLGTTAVPSNDILVFNIPCTGDGTRYVVWDIAPGPNVGVVLRGPKGNFCLDAVTQAGNAQPKVYTCLPGVPQQAFYYTADQHLAITGGTKCLAYNGGGCGLGGCAPGWVPCNSDTVQIWPLAPIDGLPIPIYQIHPNGEATKCVTPTTRAITDGTTVQIQTCLAASDPFANLQRFEIVKGSGRIKLGGTNYCLDAGVSPNNNGVVMKLWTCLDVPQQKWYYTDDNHIAITGGTTCLDVKREDGITLQTWTCGSPNPQQVFTI